MFNSKAIIELELKLNTQTDSNKHLLDSNDTLRERNTELERSNKKLVDAQFKYEVIKMLLDDDELILSVFDSELIASILMDIKKGTDPRSSNSHFYWSINQQAANLMKIYKGEDNE